MPQAVAVEISPLEWRSERLGRSVVRSQDHVPLSIADLVVEVLAVLCRRERVGELSTLFIILFVFAEIIEGQGQNALRRLLQ